ncbi:tryptophan 7-halogenase [Streptomyces misionensis]|uniref:tryptophan 7-halogenase n=1 Tax=Streptomyces misionensis TaxID=67331 RepID=UPI0033F94478
MLHHPHHEPRPSRPLPASGQLRLRLEKAHCRTSGTYNQSGFVRECSTNDGHDIAHPAARVPHGVGSPHGPVLLAAIANPAAPSASQEHALQGKPSGSCAQAQSSHEEFYTSTLAKADRAMAILDGAERCDQVRIVHDWSYDSEQYSDGRWFLSGDAAAFTDPLFSQGVQMAAQSAVSAAAAIDRLGAHPDEAETVHAWYTRAYQETYEKYHEFLAAFYTMASFSEPDSEFWSKRRIRASDDDRVERRRWFGNLVDAEDGSGWSAEVFRERATTMMSIGRHQRDVLSSEFSDDELVPARVQWVANLNKSLRKITRLEWVGEEVLLKPYYKIDPVDFRLMPKQVVANESGREMVKWRLDERHQKILLRMQRENFGFKELESELADADGADVSSQIVIRLFEAGLLRGFDKNGDRVVIQDRLRFDGVGTEYEV